MSSVGVVTQKKSKCPKKKIQSVERGENKCKISGVRKKKGIERKVPGKNQSVFG
jgi:hypothetical protein